MVLRVNVTISPADLTDLYVINDDSPSDKLLKLSDFTVSGTVLDGDVVGLASTDTIQIISSGYQQITTTLGDLDNNPNITLTSVNETENISDGTNNYPLADKVARNLINNIDKSAFDGVDQTYSATSTNAQSGTAVAEAIATDLNGKADVDLTNVNTDGTSLGASWAMPSATYVDLTLGVDNSTYTAPANGFLLLNKRSSASGQRVLVQNSSAHGVGISSYSTATGQYLVTYAPGKKGDVFTIRYTTGGDTATFRFIYAEGEQ